MCTCDNTWECVFYSCGTLGKLGIGKMGKREIGKMEKGEHMTMCRCDSTLALC